MNIITETTAISTWIVATAIGTRAGSATYFGDDASKVKTTKTERKQFRLQADEATACFASIVGWPDRSNVEAWSTFEAAKVAEINRLIDHNR
jgi:hypothetical protein